MRVVLDTNVILSSLISRSGAPFAVLAAWRKRRFDLVSHELQIEELRLASRYEKLRTRLDPALAGRLINLIRSTASMTDRLPEVRRSSDPNDDFILAIAEAGGASRLVSGDRLGLLLLEQHRGARILSPRAFADELGIA